MQTDQTVSGKTYRLVIMAALSAILLIGQLGMAFLPNIEVVSTLIILYTPNLFAYIDISDLC